VKKSRFTDEQIAYALKQQELGISVDDVCRKMGIAQATFFNWIEGWRQIYNESRPHGALGWLTPAEFARQCRVVQECGATKEPKNSTVDRHSFRGGITDNSSRCFRWKRRRDRGIARRIA
jgi:transposase-like protein